MLQRIRFLQVARILIFHWSKNYAEVMPYIEVIHFIQLVTSCKTSLPCAGKTTCADFVAKRVTSFCSLQQPSLLQDKVDSWVVKCAKSLFNSFCTNVVNQVASCYCPFYRTFNTNCILFSFIYSFIHSLFAVYTSILQRKIGIIWDKRKSKVNNHHQQLKPTLKVPLSPSSPKIALLYNCY